MAPNMDGIKTFWAVFAGSWTLLLSGGLVFLFTRRHMPVLRIRGLPLSCAAIILLHVYWLAVQLGPIYGYLVPPQTEFWIMGIYLPFGIALFQASNSRFLHVAKAQKKYAHTGGERPPRLPTQAPRWPLVARFRRYEYTAKMLTIIFAGMVLQFFLTLVMFLISRKFHPSFGVPGTEAPGTPEEQAREIGRGWEWWPSIFWQVFWAWIVAPVVLWRSRRIHDTQGWRVQTIACCLASMPAAPMWLIAVNVEAMGVVNKYWVPPQWICISIMFLEIFTIFIPCWQVLRHQSLRQETLGLIARWESDRNRRNGSGKAVGSESTVSTQPGCEAFTSEGQTGSQVTRQPELDWADCRGGLLAMSALEFALKRNPDPLQDFSALKDFSGENIAFLTAVSRWKRAVRANDVPIFSSADRERHSITLLVTPETRQRMHDRQREHFNQALRIYTEYVSRRDAEFSINISSTDLRKIEGVFEKAAQQMHCEATMPQAPPAAIPADLFKVGRIPAPGDNDKGAVQLGARQVEGGGGGGDGEVVEVDPDSTSTLGGGGYYLGDIPEVFDETVFDDAEASIKYLVLTNTWPKFVIERRSSFDSTDSNESYDTLVDMVMQRTQADEEAEV